MELRERVNENVRVYFCPGSSEEMGHFRKTGTKAMRRKPHTGCGKIQPYVADTKGRGEAKRQSQKKMIFYLEQRRIFDFFTTTLVKRIDSRLERSRYKSELYSKNRKAV